MAPERRYDRQARVRCFRSAAQAINKLSQSRRLCVSLSETTARDTTETQMIEDYMEEIKGKIFKRAGLHFQVLDLVTDPLTGWEHVIYMRISLPALDIKWVLPRHTFLQDFTPHHKD